MVTQDFEFKVKKEMFITSAIPQRRLYFGHLSFCMGKSLNFKKTISVSAVAKL